MRRTFTALSALIAAAVITGPALGKPAAPAGAELEKQFDALISPPQMSDWLKLLAAEPNHVGSPHDKANAEWVAAQFKAFGWDAHIETFQVLYPTPISESLEVVGANAFKATLTEAPVPGDDSSA